jgi:hypothetical protein
MTTPYPLGRKVNHDPRSLAYRFDTTGITVQSVKHTRRIPVLDQGNLGSCTGNAGIGALGTEPIYGTFPTTPLDEAAAINLYSAATVIDGSPGSYPPDDTGSDGLSIAKVLKSRGLISGYTHTFTLDDALKALQVTPVIVGVNWYNNMFSPAADGTVTIPNGDAVAGGHEFVLDEVDVARQAVGATNSWGTGWGVDGRFYIPFSVLSRLLSEQGDVVAFVPVTQPAPTPVPPTPIPVPDPSADQSFWDAIKDWACGKHRGANKKAADQAKAWATAKDLK